MQKKAQFRESSARISNNSWRTALESREKPAATMERSRALSTSMLGSSVSCATEASSPPPPSRDGWASSCKRLRPTDGEALVVQQITNPTNHQHLMVLVVAAVAAPLHGAQLRELLLPVAQHMRLDAAQLRDLTNREVSLGGNGREGGAHEMQVQTGKLSSVLQTSLRRQPPRTSWQQKQHKFTQQPPSGSAP